MLATKILPRIFVPSATVILNDLRKDKNDFEKVCKRTELPLYTPDIPVVKRCEPDSNEPGLVAEALAVVRSKLLDASAEVKAYKQVAVDKLNMALYKYHGFRSYLAEEENYPPKAGAISVGILTGYIFALRGGRFKRTLYASIGGLCMAAVCFPNEAAEYTKTGLAEAKKYTKIAYNFIYGVKKGDPPLELPSLTLPGSISEAWEMASSLTKSQPSGSVTGDGGEEPKS